jgi:hypothetical protein
MIKQSVITKIRQSKTCKARLQIALDKSAPTIQRYLDDNDIMLTTSNALNVIKAELGLKESQILEPQTAQA